MTKTSFDKYTQHLKSSSVPSLGLLCWYSVPESSRIAQGEFLLMITTSNAPIKPPEVPKSADVFRRACNQAKINKVPASVQGEFYNYSMRDAGYDDEFVFRTFVEERVDGNNHALDFRTLGTAIFSKSTKGINFKYEWPDDDSGIIVAAKMAQSVKDYVKSEADILPAIQIREAARKAVEVSLKGTRVRPGGGVYFITMDRAKEVEAVDHVINSVRDASFHILPLVDDTKQRQMLKASFEDETVEETLRISEELKFLLQKDKLPAKKFEELTRRFNSQKDKLAEYQKLLNDGLKTSETAIDMVQEQLINAFEKAEAF